MPNIKYSPLHSLHLKNRAKFIEFAGWTMPFSYKGTIKEHQFVRQNSGYFDVSHMGRLLIDNVYLQKVSSLICSDLHGLKSGKALYSIFTNEKGSALDDVIFWKYDDCVLLICNAANTDKITNYLQTEGILYQDLTEQTALIAVQGPEAISNLEALLTIPDSFSCLRNDIYTYARTGYTGEDGLEIMINVENLDEIISFLLHNEIEPCGLGARDTLRLEAALPLYGFELSEDISPVEAGLKWTLTNKSEYRGSDVIDEQIKTGHHKVLKKFVIDSRNIARTGTKVKAGNINGIVTSGNFSPILQKSIGFVLLESQPNTDLLEFEIRGKFIEGKILKKRFLS
jgi:aminomethyltransferase